MQKMHIAGSDKPVVFYNLDVIISVGYRVKSQRGVQFRQWATRAACDMRREEPQFALEAGVAALRWMIAGYGYDTVKKLRKAGVRLKGDERVLGDSAFVETMLAGVNEQLAKQF